MAAARGFPSTFSRVLLKNWNDRATCDASTKWTCETYVTFGTPSDEQVATGLGTVPSRQSRIASTLRFISYEERASPARGPGVCRKAAIGVNVIAINSAGSDQKTARRTSSG